MLRASHFTLLLAGALTTTAGAGGYLRQSAPPVLRFAIAPPPPPPVNEQILALDRPVGPFLVDTNAAAHELLLAVLPAYLEKVIDELVRLPAPAGGMTNDTAEAVSPVPATNGTLVVASPDVPSVESLPPGNSRTDAALQMSEIMGIFNANNTDRAARQKASVVVAAPVFLPPQPLQSGPSSRAVYRSP
jgi:hypothetical protein